MESGKWYLNRFLSNWVRGGREGGTAIWPVSREDGERLTRGGGGVWRWSLAARWALLIFRSCEDAPITAN